VRGWGRTVCVCVCAGRSLRLPHRITPKPSRGALATGSSCTLRTVAAHGAVAARCVCRQEPPPPTPHHPKTLSRCSRDRELVYTTHRSRPWGRSRTVCVQAGASASHTASPQNPKPSRGTLATGSSCTLRTVAAHGAVAERRRRPVGVRRRWWWWCGGRVGWRRG
jgi:hypothetical protein